MAKESSSEPAAHASTPTPGRSVGRGSSAWSSPGTAPARRPFLVCIALDHLLRGEQRAARLARPEGRSRAASTTSRSSTAGQGQPFEDLPRSPRAWSARGRIHTYLGNAFRVTSCAARSTSCASTPTSSPTSICSTACDLGQGERLSEVQRHRRRRPRVRRRAVAERGPPPPRAGHRRRWAARAGPRSPPPPPPFKDLRPRWCSTCARRGDGSSHGSSLPHSRGRRGEETCPSCSNPVTMLRSGEVGVRVSVGKSREERPFGKARLDGRVARRLGPAWALTKPSSGEAGSSYRLPARSIVTLRCWLRAPDRQGTGAGTEVHAPGPSRLVDRKALRSVAPAGPRRR
jgi:hypothetical protein